MDPLTAALTTLVILVRITLLLFITALVGTIILLVVAIVYAIIIIRRFKHAKAPNK
jgi:hypothetical protein